MKEGYYIHKKTGNRYVVIGDALDCTNERNGTECVVYYRYEDFPIAKYFVRESKEFHEKFTFEREY